ncbi:MAG: hypothetical protein HY445_01430 [Candidatus Niyogibacteria bacterium]|nr:hypothetical protein [Candidatus Niyogibacteria bacterium]
MVSLLFSILGERRYWLTAAIIFFVYVIVYLAATQFLIFTQRMGATDGFFAIKIAENWQELMFRQRAPFLFESIGAMYLGGLKLFISVPNMFLAATLGILIGLNGAVSYYSFRALSLRGSQGLVQLIGTVPAILSGAACCVPTLILVIGLQLTATLATVWAFFVPLSVFLLFAALWRSLRKIKKRTL